MAQVKDAPRRELGDLARDAVKPADHPAVTVPKIGVLLINLGTPDGTDYWSMRRYLDEFLSDRRVIEAPSWFWQPILQTIILTTRPSRSGAAYRSVWREDTNESPLRYFTRQQAEALASRAETRWGDRVVIDWAMRYGNPSIAAGLDRLGKQGCHRILLMALYPQYAASTTATAYDKAFDALKRMRWQPAIRTLPPYHDEPAYIAALAASITRSLGELDFEPDHVLASFHGLPKEYLLKGDPYHCHCAKTARLLREHLGWPEGRLILTFQSRFGPKEWLQPYTDVTVERLAKSGVKNLAIVSPGFSADCLETLEEIAEQAGELFHAHGGEKFAYLPCLNDEEPGMALLEDLMVRELSGWTAP